MIKDKKPRNKFEAEIYKQLKKAKVSFKYESEKVSYLIAGHYVPDFVITRSDGTKIYIETKGYFRPESKRKMVAVKKLHPSLDLRILFYPFKSKKQEAQYIKWAVKNGFMYAVGEVPKDWL